jgi:phosphohistidine phosphatase SixA
MKRVSIALAAALLCGSTSVYAQTVFVVRHAERADAGAGSSPMMASDPDLSEAGKARAQSLAATLKDAKITAIYTTQYKRTRQTAEPLAAALGLQLSVVPAADVAGLIAKVKAGGNALVVGHSNTVGEIVAGLGVAEPVKLADNEYDNLLVVIPGEKPTLVRLHFR